MIRAGLVLLLYGVSFWSFLFVVCVSPAEALISPVAYSRVVAQAEWIAYQAAQKTATAAAVGAAAGVASPASIAIRAVTGPVGWTALGVSVAVALYQTYYDSTKIGQVKEAARPPGAESITYPNISTFTVPSAAYNGQNATFSATIVSPCAGDGPVYDWMIGPFNVQFAGSAPPVGAIRGSSFAYFACHFAGGSGSHTHIPGADPTPVQVQTYLTNLSSGDPLSIETNSKPLGQGGPVPDTGLTTTVNPVTPAQMPTTVKPTAQVGPTDIKIADNVPPPANTPVMQPTTQQSQTTTTTVTNPDGSKTETKSTTGTSSCTTPAGHEQRTMGSVLVQHQAVWNTSGIIGAVNLLKNLTWPTSLPVIALPSTMFGAKTVDFNDWAWFFTALRTLVIAGATLAAYRIIFVGGT